MDLFCKVGFTMMIAHVLMEENYATLSVEYTTLEQKQNLLKSIDAAIIDFNVTPDVYIKPHSQQEPGKGKVVVEFGSNTDREKKYFFEHLIKENDLVCR